MTLCSALAGREGVVLFADSEEVLGGYARKNVDKITVWDNNIAPFRLAITGAADNANYKAMLETEIASRVLALTTSDLGAIDRAITDVLAQFYAKHIWPQSEKQSLIEFLIAVQPLPSGHVEVFHTSDTAVSVFTMTDHYKNIGAGGYLADYLSHLILGGGQTQAELALIGAYIGKEVHDNVSGVGPIDRMVLLGTDGSYVELFPDIMRQVEKNFAGLRQVIGEAFTVTTNVAEPDDNDSLEYIAGELSDTRKLNGELWSSIQDGIRQQAEYRAKYEPKRKSSPF